MEFIMRPIGIIHSPFQEKEQMPIQPSRSLANGLVEVYPEFATRHPNRPNPVGLSVVRLARREGNSLQIEGVDVLDGTPLLDIKPYVPEFDLRSEARAGWLEGRGESR